MIRPQPKPQRAPKRNRKPLRRLKWMVAKPPRRVTRPGPGSDPAHLAKVRKLPCCAPRANFIGPEELYCKGDVVAHHAGPKNNDSTAVPLCWRHHNDWHSINGNGVFKGWSKESRRAWADSAIILARHATDWRADRATPAVAL